MSENQINISRQRF